MAKGCFLRGLEYTVVCQRTNNGIKIDVRIGFISLAPDSRISNIKLIANIIRVCTKNSISTYFGNSNSHPCWSTRSKTALPKSFTPPGTSISLPYAPADPPPPTVTYMSI